MDNNQCSSSSAWQIIDSQTVMKRCEKSFFKYNLTSIPQQLFAFWGIDRLVDTNRRDIIIRYGGQDYPAYITVTGKQLTRLFLKSKLGNALACYRDSKPLPCAQFFALEYGIYELQMITSKMKSTIDDAANDTETDDVSSAVLSVLHNSDNPVGYNLRNLTPILKSDVQALMDDARKGVSNKKEFDDRFPSISEFLSFIRLNVEPDPNALMRFRQYQQKKGRTNNQCLKIEDVLQFVCKYDVFFDEKKIAAQLRHSQYFRNVSDETIEEIVDDMSNIFNCR